MFSPSTTYTQDGCDSVVCFWNLNWQSGVRERIHDSLDFFKNENYFLGPAVFKYKI